MKKGDREAALCYREGVKVIEGTYRVLSEDGVPVEPIRKRTWLGAVIRHPMTWWWIGAIALVGLTEGLW